MQRHEEVLKQIAAILDTIPDDTGLFPDEVRLEVAAKIVENFPKGIQPDIDFDLAEAFNLMTEAAVYLSGVLHD